MSFMMMVIVSVMVIMPVMVILSVIVITFMGVILRWLPKDSFAFG